MTKRLLFCLLLALSLVVFATSFTSAISSHYFPYDGLTGKVSQAGVNISLEIIDGVPIIDIVEPLNGTYLYSNYLPLKFRSYDADSLWYNLDNGPNISAVTNTTFSAVAGQHTLRFFANNSHFTSEDKMTFSINLSRLIINYQNYTNADELNTTSFYNFTYEQLTAGLDNVVLEDSEYGKILFLTRINITDDLENTDNFVDINNYTEISYNRIYIDSVNLPNFNRSALLTLYGLNFSIPQILSDGVLCSVNVCQNISYNNGTFVFNVTHFTAYSARETPTTPGGGTSTGAGTGGTSGPSGGGPLITRPAPAPPLENITGKACVEKWSCSEWTACTDGFETRTCRDLNNCGTNLRRPSEKIECILGVSIITELWVVFILVLIIALILAWRRNRKTKGAKRRK